MTDFRPDCTIHLHVETRGKPEKAAWCCSIVHHKRGRLLLVSGFLGIVEKRSAEQVALLFGLRQAQRLLQEKVELSSSFPLEGKLEPKRGEKRQLSPERVQLLQIWEGFRLRRARRMPDGEEAALLRETADRAFSRR